MGDSLSIISHEKDKYDRSNWVFGFREEYVVSFIAPKISGDVVSTVKGLEKLSEQRPILLQAMTLALYDSPC